MDIQGMLNQVLGTASASKQGNSTPGGLGGLAGGALAGGLVSLILGNKGTRKLVGNAATYGGMAILGGLAYKAIQNWRENQSTSNASLATEKDIAALQGEPIKALENSVSLQMALVKAMIGAARADGQIDLSEQSRIFDQVEKANFSAEEKGVVFDSLTKDVAPEELVGPADTLEKKAEIYLASCLVCEGGNPKEAQYLERLAKALDLPAPLVKHLEVQAAGGLNESSQAA